MSKYLQLEFSSGLFFEYSKDKKEGFEKFKSTTGKKSFRKYYEDGVTGELQSLSLRDSKIGKQISFCLKNKKELMYVSVPLLDQKSNVGSYAESAIKFLPNLKKEMKITIKGYNFKDDDGYSKIGLTFTDAKSDEKIERALSNSYYKDEKLVKGDIPAIEWKEKKGVGNRPTAKSLDKKDEYLLEVLDKATKDLAYKKDDNNKEEKTSKKDKKKDKKKNKEEKPEKNKEEKASKKDKKKVKTKKEDIEPEEEDDMPF